LQNPGSGDDKWQMKYGKWKMENGKWKMENEGKKRQLTVTALLHKMRWRLL
jgi:hypothetical protein